MPATRFGKVGIGIGIAALLAVSWWLFTEGPLRNPDAAFADFESATNRAEDQLTDPLVLNGRRVAPLVLDAIADREMHLRRYAIGFLGCSRYEPSLPALRRILRDQAEKSYFRADALEAIYVIDPEEGRASARRHTSESGLLGDTARWIDEGSWQDNCRTWWQAFTGRHG